MSPSPTNQPTNREMEGLEEHAPNHYLSVRLTVPHNVWDRVEADVLKDIPIYISYPHMGSSNENPHFHILIPNYDNTECIRKRIKSKFGEYGSGNGLYSIKSQSNGILSGIQYAGHENTLPYFKGDQVEEWIRDAPKWVEEPKTVQMKIGEKRKAVHEDHYREITFRNMLKVAFRHRTDRKLTTTSLAKVLESMHTCNWFLNVAVLRAGIPSTYFEEFEAMCHNKTIMLEGRFNRMRVIAQWEGGSDRSLA